MSLCKTPPRDDNKFDTYSVAVKPSQEIIDYVEMFRVPAQKILKNKFSVWSPVSARIRVSDNGIDYGIKIWTGSSRFPEYAMIQVKIREKIPILVLAFETNKRFTYTMSDTLFVPSWDIIDTAYIFKKRSEYIIGKKYTAWHVASYQQCGEDYIVHIEADAVFVKLYIRIGQDEDPVFLDAEECPEGVAVRVFRPTGDSKFVKGEGVPDEVRKVVADRRNEIDALHGVYPKSIPDNQSIITLPTEIFQIDSYEFKQCLNLVGMNYKIRVNIGKEEYIMIYTHDIHMISVVDDTAPYGWRIATDYVQSLLIHCDQQFVEKMGAGASGMMKAVAYRQREIVSFVIEYDIELETGHGHVRIDVTDGIPYIIEFYNLHSKCGP